MLGIVVEVQLRAEERKRYVWPVYATTLRARLECPACVLVVTPNEQVAEWAAAPLELGPNARMVLQVIGPSAVPIPRDAEHARNEPELAVLSALAHGRDPRLAETIATAAAAGVAKTAALDEDRALLYLDLVSAALGEAARAAFEALMATERYEYQSEFAKKYYGQGLAEGEVRGEARGEARGEGRAILLVLESRGVPISADHRRRVLECTDLTELERWLKRALTVSTSSELFTQ